MDPLAALLNEQPPQLLSAAGLRSRLKLLEDAARACRAELQTRWMQRAVPGALMDSLPEDIIQDIFSRLCNRLEPRIAVDLSSASKMLRELMQRQGAGASPSLLQELEGENKTAAALCLKMGRHTRSCKELREAKDVFLCYHEATISVATDLATLGELGSVLPALEKLSIVVNPDSAPVPEGLQRLAEKLGVGVLPAVT